MLPPFREVRFGFALVSAGFLDCVDYEDVYRASGGFEFQSELFAHGGKKARGCIAFWCFDLIG